MAKGRKSRKSRKPVRPFRLMLRYAMRVVWLGFAILLVAIAAYRLINPPTTPYMLSESRRLGGVKQECKDAGIEVRL